MKGKIEIRPEETVEDLKNRILIADNDDTAAVMMYMYFSNRGYEVNRAAWITDIIKIAMDNEAGTVIIDAAFCGEQTRALLDILKRLDAGLKIILTSGKCSPEHLAEAREAGIFFHAAKPLNFEELESAVAAAQNHIRRR